MIFVVDGFAFCPQLALQIILVIFHLVFKKISKVEQPNNVVLSLPSRTWATAERNAGSPASWEIRGRDCTKVRFWTSVAGREGGRSGVVLDLCPKPDDKTDAEKAETVGRCCTLDCIAGAGSETELSWDSRSATEGEVLLGLRGKSAEGNTWLVSPWREFEIPWFRPELFEGAEEEAEPWVWEEVNCCQAVEDFNCSRSALMLVGS